MYVRCNWCSSSVQTNTIDDEDIQKCPICHVPKAMEPDIRNKNTYEAVQLIRSVMEILQELKEDNPKVSLTLLLKLNRMARELEKDLRIEL